MKDGRGVKPYKRLLVQETTAKLRELILTREPQTQIGSLNEVAQMLGVGIVTVQQAARILEHEGLLAVRRGPGGGYYGMRPDEAALRRSMAAYMRVHGFGYREALEMISLLDCEIIPAAAHCRDDGLLLAMRALSQRIDGCETAEQRIAFENELRKLLQKMVSRPLVEFLTSVTGILGKPEASAAVFPGDEGVAVWKLSKRRILQAILDGDEALARFEAERYRQQVLMRLRSCEAPA
jgi:GntR family transcriptional repressor for pyruvate dehydrogenase complex